MAVFRKNFSVNPGVKRSVFRVDTEIAVSGFSDKLMSKGENPQGETSSPRSGSSSTPTVVVYITGVYHCVPFASPHTCVYALPPVSAFLKLFSCPVHPHHSIYTAIVVLYKCWVGGDMPALRSLYTYANGRNMRDRGRKAGEPALRCEEV